MVTILLGLLGLGIVVFVHEVGHFFAARLTGVEVEELSLGWGPKLAGFTRGKTLYRVSVLPIGGYCRMKGEDSFKSAMERGDENMPREPGSFYGASPWRRVIIALAGPASNLLFALIVAILVAAAGYDIHTFGNKVILASDYPFSGESLAALPAERAGLKTGDRIVSIDGKPIDNYSEIQELVANSAQKPLRLVVERENRRLELTVTPELNRDTGGGRVGLYAWVDPVIGKIKEGGSASLAGLSPGDRVVAVNGLPIEHTVDFQRILLEHPEKIHLTLERGGARRETDLVLSWDKDGNPDLGFSFEFLKYHVQADGLVDALRRGLSDTGKTISGTLAGLASLFRGNVNVLNAVSGPARITYMVGTVANQGFQESVGAGFSQVFNFLSLLSIGLGIMNLLPIPLLDGGQIVLFIIEWIKRKPLRLKTVYRYQVIGMTVVLGLFLLSTIADVSYFTGR